MLWKQVIALLVICIGVSVADRLTFGTRQNGDRYLFTQSKSTVATDKDGKHSLVIEETAIRATYVELNVTPVSNFIILLAVVGCEVFVVIAVPIYNI